MKEFKIKMSETMRKAIESVINKEDKEACLKILDEAIDDFKIAYRDKLRARIAFNACLVNELMKILLSE